VVYLIASRDADEKPLNGGDNYVIRFPANKLPDSVVNAYWSVILVGVPDYRVAPNPLNRFNFNNYSPLKKGADGSLTIASAQSRRRAFRVQLATVARRQALLPHLPYYVPKDAVKRGEWTLPPVTATK